MKKASIGDGQRVSKEVFNQSQDAKTDAILERQTDIFSDGIVREVDDDFAIVPGANNTPLTPSITVQKGLASKNGERIYIDDDTITYNAAAPATLTGDGIGGFVNTPQSTGSKNIAMTGGSINYIFIKFLNIIDPTFFTLHRITTAKQFYKQGDGYEIVVNLTGVNPDPTLYLQLGQVDQTGGGAVLIVNISLTGRTYLRSVGKRLGVKTTKVDKSDRTILYPADTIVDVDDHVRCIGTGTPSSSNPHGLTVDDIGGGASSVLTHRKEEHTPGIMGTSSSLLASITIVTPVVDIFNITPITPGDVVIINGGRYTSLVNTVAFLITDPNGVWYVFADSVDQTIKKSQIDPTGDITKLPLWSVTWTDMGAGDFDLTGLTDLRKFGSIGPNNIQYDTVITKGTTAVRATLIPVPKQGHLYVNDTLSIIERYRGSIWEPIGTNFPSGTKLLFYQATPPVGWTPIALNDKFLRVVTSGTSGGSSSAGLAASTNLAHTHGSYGAVNTDTFSAPLTSNSFARVGVSQFEWMDHYHQVSAHEHASALGAFAYADVVAATKD